MHIQATLQQQAIVAAKEQNWTAAVEHNERILETSPEDLGALNRLGLAHLQLKQPTKAKKYFQKVLELDRSNTIAKKHLARLKSNQNPQVPTFTQVYFIEEPGKSKIIELHRLAGKQVLEELVVGQRCELKPKSRYISVERDGVYIGALPEDLSFRLTKLIGSGNKYDCYIHSFTSNNCSIYVKEAVRAEKNKDIHSFPLAKGSLAAINELDQAFLLEDDIPVEVSDSESSDRSEVFYEVNSDDE